MKHFDCGTYDFTPLKEYMESLCHAHKLACRDLPHELGHAGAETGKRLTPSSTVSRRPQLHV
ncbi:hypothetical protein GCM10009672_16570 [Nesterenkonia lutea]